MVWVVSKIIGDGKSVETAYRTAAQAYPISILNANAMLTNKLTGDPIAPFAVFEIPDDQAAMLASEPGCYVLPPAVDALSRTAVAAKLLLQGVVVDLVGVTNSNGLAAKIQQQITEAKAQVIA